MEATRDTLVARAARYKRLVISVSILVLGVLLVAMPVFGWRAAGMLLLLPGLVLGFFARDFGQVCRWRNALLAQWASGDMVLDLAASTLRQMPAVPPHTLDGMLRCLPACPGPGPDPARRQALWRTQDELGRLAVAALHARSAMALVTGSAAAAALWWPRLALPALGIACAALAAGVIGSLALHRRLRILHRARMAAERSGASATCEPSLEGFSRSALKSWR